MYPWTCAASRAILAGMSIGGTLAEARRVAGLTVADVSARTRIREGLIRAIEQDEFASCGGDFYARGHIRAIAGVVGADPRPLISEYDTSYSPGGQLPPKSGGWSAPSEGQAGEAGQAGLDELFTPAPPETPPGRSGGRPRGGSPGRSGHGWLVPLIMLVVIVGIVALAYQLTSGKGGSQPSDATASNRAATASGSPGQRPSPSGAPTSGTATPPPAAAEIPVKPVSAAAVGPAGTSDGDDPQDAPLALSGDPATPWHTDWYATARFGNLQTGTGLLVDLGRSV